MRIRVERGSLVSKSAKMVLNFGTTATIIPEIIRNVIDPTVEIVKVPYSEAYEEGFEDMKRRVPDISKVRNLIDFSPTIGIDGILEKVIEYEKTKRSAG